MIPFSKKRLYAIVCFGLCMYFCIADTTTDSTPVPYSKDEFPQWVLDARRTEIITFGSLPFVTLGTTLAYSIYRYYDHGFSSSYIPNPFAKSSGSANLDTGEQMMIVKTAACISIGLGLFDLVFNLIQRKNAEKKAKIASMNNLIKIKPLDTYQNSDQKTNTGNSNEFLYGGIQSAIF